MFWGMQLVSSAAFTVPIQHYPQYRGDVAAIVKSFVGVGGGVTTQLFIVIWGVPDASPTALNALLLWAGLSAGLNLVAACVVPRAAVVGCSEPRRMLTVLFYVIILLGVCTTLSSMVPTDSLAHDGLLLAMSALCVAPLGVIFNGLCVVEAGEEASTATAPTPPRQPRPRRGR